MLNSGFRHPLLLTSVTQGSTALIAFLLVRVFRLVKLEREPSWEYVRAVLVVGGASSVTICTGTSAYL